MLEKILRDHEELSSLPQTLAEVLRITRDEDSSASDLSEVLLRDPALTARILRMVNSPFYGLGREVTTVSQAVLTVGMRGVTSLALSSSIYDLTGKWSSIIDRQKFWSHSLEVAIASRSLAEASGLKCPEEAFVCGLLHEIGLPVLEKSFPDEFEQIWKGAACETELLKHEQQQWGTDHIKVGQFLMQQWNLPADLVASLDSLSGTVSRDDSFLAKVLGAAHCLSRFAIADSQPAPAQLAELKGTMTGRLKLEPEKIAEIEQQLLTTTISEAAFLEMDIGSIEDILIEANQLLYRQYTTVENLLRENNEMREEMARVEMEKIALENLQTISATFSHYVNNATATILGRAQLVEAGVNSGAVTDPSGSIVSAMQIIINSVSTISTFIDEIKGLTSFDRAVYSEDSYILDIESRIKDQIVKTKQKASEVVAEPTI